MDTPRAPSARRRGALAALGALLANPAAPVHAQFPYETEWVVQLGTPLDDYAQGVAANGVGGVCLGGGTYADLGGPNAGPLDPPILDSWIARVQGAGELAWLRQFGVYGHDGVRGLAFAGGTGVFAAGTALGSSTLLRQGVSGGAPDWRRSFGTQWTDMANAATLDRSGYIYVAGFTHYSYAYSLHSDAFIARFDSAGNLLWLHEIGSGLDDEATGVCPDSSDGVMVCGWTTAGLTAPTVPNGDVPDSFIARYNKLGHQLWLRQHRTAARDKALAIARDDAGGLYVGGFTTGNLGGPPMGKEDAILARWDRDGRLEWVRHLGTGAPDMITALTPDGAGGVIAAGFTGGALAQPAPGGGDVFITRYDEYGNRLWITQVGSPGKDYPYAMAPRGAWGVVVAGETTGNWGAPNAGQRDAFAVCLAEPCYADCNRNQFLGGGDFACFWNKFTANDPYCDCTMDGLLNAADWSCFQTRFVAGCP